MQGAQLVLNQRRLALTRSVVLEKVLDPGFFSTVGRAVLTTEVLCMGSNLSPKSVRNQEIDAVLH